MHYVFRLFVAAACVLACLHAGPAEAKRVALVVGNAAYDRLAPLKNPQRDAAVVADRLKDLGFEVTELFNADAFSLNRAASQFVTQASGADLALFYFAGHGVQLFDRNFLVARDANPQSVSRPQDLGLDLRSFIAALRGSGAVRLALLLDACRDNPLSFEDTVRILDRLRTDPAFKASTSTAGRSTRGLARVELGPPRQGSGGSAQTLLFFAAQPGAVSFDGAGLNSFYVEGLKEQLANPDRPFTEVLRGVSAYVRTVTSNKQVPQIVSDWTDEVALAASKPAARIEYQVSPATFPAARALTPAERKQVIRTVTGFTKLQGNFIAKASIGDQPDFALAENDKKRANDLGFVNGLAISYDLDRDGRDETLHIYYRQVSYFIAVEVEGVKAEISNCIDGGAERVEIALRDINGDRRPEVWIAYEGETGPGWGTFCILEYKGLPNLADLRRGNTGKVSAGYAAFRTLLRGESGWHVTVANDNRIKACGGTGCHTAWAYSFDGERFRLLDDGSQAPVGPFALPFRDESDRAAKLFAGFVSASTPLTPVAWHVTQPTTNVTAAIARIGTRTEIAFQCSYLPGLAMALESIVVRDLAPPGTASYAEARVDETLTYGESLASAPMLIDGKACVLGGVGNDKDRGIRLSPVFGAEGNCWQKLFNASTITLPIIWRNTSLLQFRMTGAAPVITAARRACRGERTALKTPSSAAPRPSGDSGDVRRRIVRFITERYFRVGTGGAAEIGRIVAAHVNYYGKQRVARAQVIRDKLRYYAAWPDRTYNLIPETLSISAAAGRHATWNAEFQYTFQVGGRKGVRRGRGIARLELVSGAGGDFLIASESGSVLERY